MRAGHALAALEHRGALFAEGGDYARNLRASRGMEMRYELMLPYRIREAITGNWPVVLPNQNSLTINPWASTHTYTGNAANNNLVLSYTPNAPLAILTRKAACTPAPGTVWRSSAGRSVAWGANACA